MFSSHKINISKYLLQFESFTIVLGKKLTIYYILQCLFSEKFLSAVPIITLHSSCAWNLFANPSKQTSLKRCLEDAIFWMLAGENDSRIFLLEFNLCRSLALIWRKSFAGLNLHLRGLAFDARLQLYRCILIYNRVSGVESLLTSLLILWGGLFGCCSSFFSVERIRKAKCCLWNMNLVVIYAESLAFSPGLIKHINPLQWFIIYYELPIHSCHYANKKFSKPNIISHTGILKRPWSLILSLLQMKHSSRIRNYCCARNFFCQGQYSTFFCFLLCVLSDF